MHKRCSASDRSDVSGVDWHRKIWGPFQYQIRGFIVRAREVSKPVSFFSRRLVSLQNEYIYLIIYIDFSPKFIMLKPKLKMLYKMCIGIVCSHWYSNTVCLKSLLL